MKKILLFLLFGTNIAMAGELSLYFLPSKKGMDWSTPKNVFASFLKNRITFATLPYGHAWVGLRCDGTEELTGTSSDKIDYLGQLLFHEEGFSVFYHSFEGKLEDTPEVTEKMKDVHDRMNFLRVKLNAKQCKRVSQYLKEFREKNVGRHFGPALRPRQGEGSNSGSFAVSFLDVLNLFDEDMKLSWITQVGLPLDVCGPPLRDEGVSFFKAYAHGDSWAKDNEKQIPLTLWNIDKMHAWVNKKLKDPRGADVINDKNMKGIALDKSHFPAPEEPIWEQVIDPKTKQIIPSGTEKAENPIILKKK